MPAQSPGGRIVAVREPVLDIRPTAPPLPAPNAAVMIMWDRPGTLIAEVAAISTG